MTNILQDPRCRAFSSSTIETLAVDPIRLTPISIISSAVSSVRIPPAAFIFTASPTIRFISMISAAVAPPLPKPVEVLIYCSDIYTLYKIFLAEWINDHKRQDCYDN